MSLSPAAVDPAELPPESTFGPWMRAQRANLKWTQDELAAHVNANGGNVLNGSVIAHWEAGNRRPNGANLLAVCVALSVSIAEVQRVMAGLPEDGLTTDRSPS